MIIRNNSKCKYSKMFLMQVCILLAATLIFSKDKTDYSSLSSNEKFIIIQKNKTAIKDRKTAKALIKKGLVFHKKGLYKKSELFFFYAALKDTHWELPLFNLACAAAKQNKLFVALQYLDLALQKNKSTVLIWIKNDSDLKEVRKVGEFQILLQTYDPNYSIIKPESVIGNWNNYNDNEMNSAMPSSLCLSLKADRKFYTRNHCNYGTSCGGTWSINRNGVINLDGNCFDHGNTLGHGPGSNPNSKINITANYDKMVQQITVSMNNQTYTLTKSKDSTYTCCCFCNK